jgi:hypothetical protein
MPLALPRPGAGEILLTMGQQNHFAENGKMATIEIFDQLLLTGFVGFKEFSIPRL